MGEFKVILSRKKTFWKLKPRVKLSVLNPNEKTIRKTRRQSKKLERKIDDMTANKKREILVNKGIIRTDSNAPESIMNTMLKALV
jgi:hypothetical protein